MWGCFEWSYQYTQEQGQSILRCTRHIWKYEISNPVSWLQEGGEREIYWHLSGSWEAVRGIEKKRQKKKIIWSKGFERGKHSEVTEHTRTHHKRSAVISRLLLSPSLRVSLKYVHTLSLRMHNWLRTQARTGTIAAPVSSGFTRSMLTAAAKSQRSKHKIISPAKWVLCGKMYQTVKTRKERQTHKKTSKEDYTALAGGK